MNQTPPSTLDLPPFHPDTNTEGYRNAVRTLLRFFEVLRPVDGQRVGFTAEMTVEDLSLAEQAEEEMVGWLQLMSPGGRGLNSVLTKSLARAMGTTEEIYNKTDRYFLRFMESSTVREYSAVRLILASAMGSLPPAPHPHRHRITLGQNTRFGGRCLKSRTRW